MADAVVEDSHDQLLARLRARGGHAEIEVAALKLGAERAVLRLALLGDVHRREDLEDVDHGVAGRPVERLGGVQDAVDPIAHRELLGGRLEVDVGRPAQHGVVDQLLGGHVRPRFLGLPHPRRIFLGRALGLADERDRRTGPIDRADVAVEQRLHPQLEQDVVGHLAEMVGSQHFLVVGHRLVAGVDVSQQRERNTPGAGGPDRGNRPGSRSTSTSPSTPEKKTALFQTANLRLLSSLVSCSTQSVVQAQSR